MTSSSILIVCIWNYLYGCEMFQNEMDLFLQNWNGCLVLTNSYRKIWFSYLLGWFKMIMFFSCLDLQAAQTMYQSIIYEVVVISIYYHIDFYWAYFATWRNPDWSISFLI